MSKHNHDQFKSGAGSSTISLPEILGAFSYALDLTEGQPLGHAQRACWFAMKTAEALSCSDEELTEYYYAVLMKDLGCSSNAARVAEIFLADDRHMKQSFKTIGTAPQDFAEFVAAETGKNASEEERARAMQKIVDSGAELLNGLISTRCHRGADIARQLRFSERTAEAIFNLDEHWDGSGNSRGLSGSQIPLGSRLALLAQIVDVFYVLGGPDAARREVEHRCGTWLDPELCRTFLRISDNDRFWRPLDANCAPDELRSLSAHGDIAVDEDYLEDITAAFGSVIDAKSPFTGGHSSRVGALTGKIASRIGFDDDDVRHLRRAASLHDVGKLGVSSRILEKPAKLDDGEWREMRSHAQLTTDILGRISVLKDMAMIAGSHHERLDGSGYPLKLNDRAIAIETRIITAADIYDALTADRPYRAAMETDRAFAIMESECGSAIDHDCLATLKEIVAEEAQASQGAPFAA